MTDYYALPYFELQQAIYQKLIACEALINITRKDDTDLGVCDAVDENTPYPYVTISEPSSSPSIVGGKIMTLTAVSVRYTKCYQLVRELSWLAITMLLMRGY